VYLGLPYMVPWTIISGGCLNVPAQLRSPAPWRATRTVAEQSGVKGAMHTRCRVSGAGAGCAGRSGYDGVYCRTIRADGLG
jgi:hypothetical protein